ncbi:MAG: helix-turn-helix transcriptional regulator [Actinomycetota bacterium]
MTIDTIGVAHREPLVADGLAAALGALLGLSDTWTASSAEGVLGAADRAQAVVLDEQLPGSRHLGGVLARRGIHVVVLGETEAGPEVRVSTSSSLAALADAIAPGTGQRNSTTHNLTEREQQILTLVARGMAGKQVARHLGISPKTVEHHKTRIFSKLGVPNQTAAACLVFSANSSGGPLPSVEAGP